jgi:hypothetical protein
MATLTTTNPTLFAAADGISMPNWKKDAFDIEDFTLDWANWIDDGDSIIAVNYIIATGSPLTILSTDIVNNELHNFTTAWIQGGSYGETDSIVVQITTNEGREMQRTFKITCGPN